MGKIIIVSVKMHRDMERPVRVQLQKFIISNTKFLVFDTQFLVLV